jgi:hypothetical protein
MNPFRLRTYLLLLSVLELAVGMVFVSLIWLLPYERIDTDGESSRTKGVSRASFTPGHVKVRPESFTPEILSVPLQRPLFDPPPLPEVVEIKPPPVPPPLKVLATMIEPNSRQAMFVDDAKGTHFVEPNGQIAVAGESVEIVSIEENAVLVRFRGEEFLLRTNGP